MLLFIFYQLYIFLDQFYLFFSFILPLMCSCTFFHVSHMLPLVVILCLFSAQTLNCSVAAWCTC